MQVIDIITEQENINSAQALKSAFTDSEWANILQNALRNQFLRRNTASSRESLLRSLNAEIGKNFSAITPSQWAGIAGGYGLRMPTQPSGVAGWQQIYNFLQQYNRRSDLPDASGTDPGLEDRPRANTPETFEVISTWVSQPQSFQNDSQVKTYLNSWLSKLKQERTSEWWDEFVKNNRNNQSFGLYLAATNSIQGVLDSDETLTKQRIDTELIAMLRLIDNRFATIQNAERTANRQRN
jgi:hypothetical protein